MEGTAIVSTTIAAPEMWVLVFDLVTRDRRERVPPFRPLPYHHSASVPELAYQYAALVLQPSVWYCCTQYHGMTEQYLLFELWRSTVFVELHGPASPWYHHTLSQYLAPVPSPSYHHTLSQYPPPLSPWYQHTLPQYRTPPSSSIAA
eukprot:3940926-Rhodomonas_salina.3